MNKITRFSWPKLLFLVLTICLLYLGGLKYTTSHEFLHERIYKRYNIPSITEINYGKLEGRTLISTIDYYKCNDYCKLQHSLNDIVGYNVTIIIFSAWSMFFLWLLYKRLFENENKE